MEKFTPRGEVRIRIYDRTGNLLEDWHDKNLVVNAGRAAMARLFGEADENKSVSQIGFGTSGAIATPADTSLTGVFQKAIGEVTYPDAQSAQFAWSLETDEGNGMTIREFGLFAVDGTLLARRTREAIIKTSDLRLEGTWTITF